MIRTLKSALGAMLPPLLLRWSRRRHRMRFDGPFPSWDAAANASEGYSAPLILERVIAANRQVVRGEAAYERDSVTFAEPAADPLLLAELERQAAIAAGAPLVVIDIGGSLGSSYRQHRRFLPAGLPVQWHIVEQPHYVEAGAREFQSEELRFHDSLASAQQAAPRPALVLLASVLPYLPEPWAMLETVTRWPARALVIFRTPFADETGDKVVVQHVPPNIYRASYPSWIFSTKRFVAFWQSRGATIEWHPTAEGEAQAGSLHFTYRSAVVRPAASSART